MTSSEQEEIYKLGDKAKSCWSATYAQTQNVPLTPSQSKLPYEYEGCLIKTLGETAYKQIYSGVRTPTYEEHLKYEACYGGRNNVSSVTFYTNQETLPKTTETCLKTVLTGGTYDKVRSGTIDVPYESRDKVNRCFGINPQPFEETRVYKAPDTVKNCLLDAIGASRFQEIQRGKSEPSEEEKTKSSLCFAKLNKDQSKFLPLPPEQVHFLKSKPEIVNVSDFKQETQKLKGQDVGGKIVLSGKALPNATVNIYIFSDPIVVTTKTDENGDWVYELNEPLKGESHIAYATVRSDNGEIVRSDILDFQIQAAPDEPAIEQFIEETSATSAQKSFLYYSVIALIILTLSVSSVIAVVNVRKISARQKEGSVPNRDSERKL